MIDKEKAPADGNPTEALNLMVKRHELVAERFTSLKYAVSPCIR
jgi:hypothetical protein